MTADLKKVFSPKAKVLIFMALALGLLLIGIRAYRAGQQEYKDQSLRCIRDLSYVPSSNDPFQTLDLYIPKKARAKPIPVIVWIHGGAWMAGDKNHPPADPLLAEGYAVASLNYRLSDKHPHPAQIFDCKAAVRFLRAHAKEFGLDPGRIGVWGHSAGGHLAALLGTSADAKNLEGELGNNNESSRVQAVAEWAGPTDLGSCASQAPPNCKIDFKSPTNPIAVFMGTAQSPAAYLEASPISYVSSDDPPFFVLHAEDDDVVPVGQAFELCSFLKKKQVPLTCVISAGGGHALSKPDFFYQTLRFFNKHL